MDVVIKSTRIYTEDGLVNGAMKVKDGVISCIMEDMQELDEQNSQVIDYGNKRIIPGIIDLHCHGFAGWSFYTFDEEEVKSGAKALPSVGVTGFQPTTGMNEKGIEKLGKALETIGGAISQDYKGARMLGIHMEGPFINPSFKGAANIEAILKPNVDDMNFLWESSEEKITYVTMAPEVEGAYELMKYLKKKGIVVGAGHTNSSNKEMKEAIKKGIDVAIHTGNAMKGMHQRDAGALGTVLLDDNIYCELIADFFHVCPETIDIMFRIKAKDKFVLVSDGSPLSGVKPGVYNLPGRQKIIEESGLVHLPNGTISGSSKYVLFGIQNLVEKLDVKLEEAVRMSSLNPAKLLKIDNKKGSIRAGKDADFVVIDDDYEAIATYVEGYKAYDRDEKCNLINKEIEKCYAGSV